MSTAKKNSRRLNFSDILQGAGSVQLGIYACLIAVIFPSFSLYGEQRRLPNIVMILADDMGWGDVSAFNKQAAFKTPHIDHLAKQGCSYLNAYTPASVCSPTRYGLLTGRYPWRTRMQQGVLYHYDPALISRERMTVASMLQEKGYATACIGKWHLGLDWQPTEGDPGDWEAGQMIRYADMNRIAKRIDFNRPITNGPTHIGFDYFYGTAHQGADHVVIENDRRIPGVSLAPGEHDDIFVEKAVSFMSDMTSQDSDKPFLLYLALGAPHVPLVAPKRLQNKSGLGRRVDMCLWVDESVGRIDSALDRLGIAEDTLVIFASDNGAADPSRFGNEINHRPSGPYRGFKTDVWEGGFRIPFVLRWPGKVREGTVSSHLLCLTDVMATLAAVVNAELPEWSAEDSINQLPALLEDVDSSPRDHVILQSYAGVMAIRDERWKLILGTHGSGGHQSITPGWQPVYRGWDRTTSIRIGQLYDLISDPYELYDRFENESEMVNRLRSQLERAELTGRTFPYPIRYYESMAPFPK
ncbi:sulfatase family protein [Bythopirellula polymerisocia]|uniref:Arylsulfatase n=1 Tax=Bythopirellula polymerisocia TaxID=2528003 RepID=A0A5C6C9X5_9BACT|nr:arylsulfatase [Bythopirellula polymerisocia]TWU21390.1 Arylsulfatase [Bythopirellula polymerisocia]